jgi:hypothetical protein
LSQKSIQHSFDPAKIPPPTQFIFKKSSCSSKSVMRNTKNLSFGILLEAGNDFIIGIHALSLHIPASHHTNLLVENGFNIIAFLTNSFFSYQIAYNSYV